MKIVGCLLAGVMLLTSCKSTDSKMAGRFDLRKPASSEDLLSESQKILTQIGDNRVFNARTCGEYVETITSTMFRLPADYFIPKTPQQVESFKAQGPEIMDTIFQIRVVLHEKMKDFDKAGELTKQCEHSLREAFQYARFSEEYLLEWLISNQVYKYKETAILENRKPSTWTNPQFADFKLQSGDVLLVRGSSYVSAMIARIGDEEGNFSHMAIVGEDSRGKLHVVEALIQYGTIVTPLEEWRKKHDARVALYRFKDANLAQKAGRVIYDKATSSKTAIRYDFTMDDEDYSSFFCSEVIRYAYDKASGGEEMIPKYRTLVTKFKDHAYPRSLGVKKDNLFSPNDIEVDPRFDFIAEFRHYPLLRQVRMQDAVLQSVYQWMAEDGYDFHWNPVLSTKAYMAKVARQFGLVKTMLPTYMPLDSLKTVIEFEAVAVTLEKNIYAKEDAFYKQKGYLPSVQDLLAINEDYRVQDCKLYAGRFDSNVYEASSSDPSKFHGFFRSKKAKCY